MHYQGAGKRAMQSVHYKKSAEVLRYQKINGTGTTMISSISQYVSTPIYQIKHTLQGHGREVCDIIL